MEDREDNQKDMEEAFEDMYMAETSMMSVLLYYKNIYIIYSE